MSVQYTDVDLLVRVRCFLCDALRYPWAMLREYDVWVCRQCINYEGNQRLPYTINNVRVMKNHVRPYQTLRIKSTDQVVPTANKKLPEVIVSLPVNAANNDAEPLMFGGSRVTDIWTSDLNDPRLRSCFQFGNPTAASTSGSQRPNVSGVATGSAVAMN